MTIDEAIAHAREEAKEQRSHIGTWDEEYSKRCEEYAREHEQLAAWLEDYKRIKMIIPIEQALKNEYNKAIDDFVKLVHKHDWNIRNINENSFIYGAIDTLAEQLKAGIENEQT